MTKQRAIRSCLVIVALSAGIAKAEEPWQEDRDQVARFELFNECKPMSVRISSLDEDATNIGLNRDSLHAALESRLRSAKLYGMSFDWFFVVPALVLRANVSSSAFTVALEYHKGVCHTATGECGSAPTWRIASFGSHGDDAGLIRSAVVEHMDQFLVEYLRVNQEACDSGPTVH